MCVFGAVDAVAATDDVESRKSTGVGAKINRTRPTSSGISSSERKKSSTILTTSSRRKRDQQIENLRMATVELRNHFNHRNLDAIVRVIRAALEKLRKRITLTFSYGN